MMKAESRPIKLKSTGKLLESNPKVSKPVVAQWRELEKQLEKLGVDTKPRYTLSPPFGGNVSNLSSK